MFKNILPDLIDNVTNKEANKVKTIDSGRTEEIQSLTADIAELEDISSSQAVWPNLRLAQLAKNILRKKKKDSNLWVEQLTALWVAKRKCVCR